MWLTLGYGHPDTRIPLCWEQRNHSRQDQLSRTRNTGWVLLEPCSSSVTEKGNRWFGTDWPCRQVFAGQPRRVCNSCAAQIFGSGARLCHWAAGAWLFPGTGENLPHGNKNCLPLLQATWIHSVLHWYGHWVISVPSIGLEDITAHVEVLTKFTQQVLNDNWQSLSFLNT